MRNNVETSTVGEILFEEFMKPNNISAYKLVKEINVSISSIQNCKQKLEIRENRN